MVLRYFTAACRKLVNVFRRKQSDVGNENEDPHMDDGQLDPTPSHKQDRPSSPSSLNQSLALVNSNGASSPRRYHLRSSSSSKPPSSRGDSLEDCSSPSPSYTSSQTSSSGCVPSSSSLSHSGPSTSFSSTKSSLHRQPPNDRPSTSRSSSQPFSFRSALQSRVLAPLNSLSLNFSQTRFVASKWASYGDRSVFESKIADYLERKGLASQYPRRCESAVVKSAEINLVLQMSEANRPPVGIINFIDEEVPIFKLVQEYVLSPTLANAFKMLGDYEDKELKEMIRKGRITACGCACADLVFMDCFVECTEDCGCTLGPCCPNRATQNGRTVPLFIFKDHRVGFSLHTPVDIKKGQFVCSYAGQVITAHESDLRGENPNYFWGMNNDVKITQTKRRFASSNKSFVADKLCVDSREMGNESRFIAHHCEGNMEERRVLVERRGAWYHQNALMAKRDIGAGEPLTLDYFSYMEGPVTGNARYHAIFSDCLCGSSICKFPVLNEEELQERLVLLAHDIRVRKEMAESTTDPWVKKFRMAVTASEETTEETDENTSRPVKKARSD